MEDIDINAEWSRPLPIPASSLTMAHNVGLTLLASEEVTDHKPHTRQF